MCRRYIERMDYVNEYVKALLPSRTTCSLSLCKDYRLHGQYKSNVGRRTGQNCKMVRQKEVLFLLGVMISATCGAPKFLPYPAWNTLVSNPAGAIESVQAGGGSVPGHQGGGIKLLDTADNGDLDEWMYWTQYLQKELQNHRHHHNHH